MSEQMTRTVKHPGPVNPDSVYFLPTRIKRIKERLESGVTLLDAFDRVLKKHGCKSAVAKLSPTRFWPAVYVLPALSRSSEHAVFYSDRHYPSSAMQVQLATVTAGIKSGSTWIHCHARWTDGAGKLHCGHVLPDETVLMDPVELELALLVDAGFEVGPDQETNFSLFWPSTAAASTSIGDDSGLEHGWCIRMTPNHDLCSELEHFVEKHVHKDVQVLGGVGSTIGAVFDDGRVVEPFVTELLIENAHVSCHEGRCQAEVEITLVDYMGGVNSGCLERMRNPILVTCEMVLAERS